MSIYIRTRDCIDGVNLVCFTCGKLYPSFGKGCAQNGHFINGRHSGVMWDERAAHGQCYNCNINLKGNWRKYEDHMLADYGQKVVDELKALDRIDLHLKVQDYLDIEMKYKNKLKEL
jgi:DNA-directed RNA polymerase subunit N (RpoN/RPB10)